MDSVTDWIIATGTVIAAVGAVWAGIQARGARLIATRVEQLIVINSSWSSSAGAGGGGGTGPGGGGGGGGGGGVYGGQGGLGGGSGS